MQRRPFGPPVFALGALIASVSAVGLDSPVGDTDLDAGAAVERALPLLQESAATWTADVACFSCHHQGFGALAVAMARELRFEVDDGAFEAEADAVREDCLERYEALLVCDGVGVFGRATILLGLGAHGRPRDDVSDSVAHFLAARQTVSGAWYSNEHRPPFEDSHVSATVLTLRALQLYGPEGRAEEIDARVRRAGRWLEAVVPENGEERSMRLLGLAWCGASAETIEGAAADLLSRQRDDGGWAQIATRGSDPYATGQALVVLNQAAGVGTDDPAWRRGARFLLDAQRDDGSWHVDTRRRIKGLPMVESGFPHGRDQFISYFASTWACMALSLAARGSGPTRTLFGSPRARDDTDRTASARGLTPLQRAAAFGSIDELRCLLEGGAAPDEPGPKGVTALMLAVHDDERVELLLEYGADPDAESEWGYTPLLMASITSGAAPALERLLGLGVSVDCRGENGATPLVCAASMGDVHMVEELLEAGAWFPPGYLQYALVYAATCDDVEMGRLLLEIGADVDEGKRRTPLTSAAISGYVDFVELLIDAGAELDVPDEDGMTALSWAAKVDPGHTRVLEALLRAGADTTVEANDGRTPLELAKRYGNARHARVLRDPGAADE